MATDSFRTPGPFYSAVGWYQYLPLAETKSIRLVELHPGHKGDEINISISHSVIGGEEYEALSYEWGLPHTVEISKEGVLLTATARLQSLIMCQGRHLMVTKNLQSLLEGIRYPDKSRRLWIDAISINQQDVKERSNQVRFMHEIYKTAASVILWIGEQRKDTGEVFKLIPQLATWIELDNDKNDHHHPPIALKTPEFVKLMELARTRYRNAVQDVFTRPYFGRMWVVQEIVTAARATVTCGEFQIDWNRFYNALYIVQKYSGLAVDHDPTSGNSVHPPIRWIWQRPLSLGLIRKWGSDLCGLHTLLKYFLAHEVTDPRDRVYGMIGMVVPQGKGNSYVPIQPDYSKSVQEVYRDAVEWSMSDTKSLSILQLCDAPATNKLKGLPTWVPDLSKGQQKCHIGPSIGLISRFKNDFHAFIKGDTLFTRALIFDTVSLARSPCTRAGLHMVMMEQFNIYSSDHEPYPGIGCSKLEALWRTLLTNRINGGLEPAAKELGDHFCHCMARETLFGIGLPNKLSSQDQGLKELAMDPSHARLRQFFREDVEKNTSLRALINKHEFLSFLYHCLEKGDGQLWVNEAAKDHLCDGDEGRQFFVTSKAYMGVGPPCPPITVIGDDAYLPPGSGVKAGDVVAVLPGSEFIFVLRRDRTGFYTIVGNAYVHSLTEGTCFGENDRPAFEMIQIR